MGLHLPLALCARRKLSCGAGMFHLKKSVTPKWAQIKPLAAYCLELRFARPRNFNRQAAGCWEHILSG